MSVLADVLSRAGASDTDREAWLAERREGVTATEVRDLMLGRRSTSKLAAVKLGWEPEQNISRLQRIQWGNVREPVIADILTGEGFEHETRVFHHQENSRWLASPDGLRVNFDDEVEITEIKTAEHPMPPGSEAWTAAGYEFQVQWGMLVTGASRCRVAVEECVRVGSWFEPGPVELFWVERDESTITDLMSVADGFLAAVDGMRDEGVDPVAVALLEDALSAGVEEKRARAALEAYCASTGLSSLRVPGGSLSYTVPKGRTLFRQAAFREAHPDMFDEFVETMPASGPVLRVMPTRGKKEDEA